MRRTKRRSGARWWLVVLVAAALAAFYYLYLGFWFVVHQREFQYSQGGKNGSPEAVGLADFAAVPISTEDGERIVGWWAPPSGRGGVVLLLHGTPSTLLDTVRRLPILLALEAQPPTGLPSRPTGRGTGPPKVVEPQGWVGYSRPVGPASLKADRFTIPLRVQGWVGVSRGRALLCPVMQSYLRDLSAIVRRSQDAIESWIWW
jgi:hypothetical protein